MDMSASSTIQTLYYLRELIFRCPLGRKLGDLRYRRKHFGKEEHFLLLLGTELRQTSLSLPIPTDLSRLQTDWQYKSKMKRWTTVHTKTKLNPMVWVRERTIPTERPPLVGEVLPTCADRRCHVVSVTDSSGRISRFSRQEPLLFYQVAPPFVLTRLSAPRSRPTTFFFW
jgi:hypothetical protein